MTVIVTFVFLMQRTTRVHRYNFASIIYTVLQSKSKRYVNTRIADDIQPAVLINLFNNKLKLLNRLYNLDYINDCK